MYGARALGLRPIRRYGAKAGGLRLLTSVTPNHRDVASLLSHLLLAQQQSAMAKGLPTKRFDEPFPHTRAAGPHHHTYDRNQQNLIVYINPPPR